MSVQLLCLTEQKEQFVKNESPPFIPVVFSFGLIYCCFESATHVRDLFVP